MAHKPEIEYVRYYSIGSAAKALECQPAAPKRTAKRRPEPVKKIVIPFDSIAVIGTVAAVVMLVCMVLGLIHVTNADRQIIQLQDSISEMEVENARLQEQYRQSFDLEKVKTAAASMGLVPRDQVKHIQITIPEPVVEEEPSWWESFVTTIRELFAYQ